jgi:protein required for attachment to host cells
MSALVLVANAGEAFLYKIKHLRTGELELVKKFKHPESREKGVDLISDRPGNYHSKTGAGSAYEKNKPKEVEAENFAIELRDEIEEMFKQNGYKQLVIAATPHFYGVIKKHLNQSIIADVIHVPKDYTKNKAKIIIERLREYIFT